MIHGIILNKGQFDPLTIRFTGKADANSKNKIQQHLTRIAQVHSFPKDKIVVHVMPQEKLRKEGIKAKFDSEKKKFYVDEEGTSFQHEFGHFIDRFVLGTNGQPWSETNSGYRNQFGFKKRPRDKKKFVQYYDPMRSVKGYYTPKQDGDKKFTSDYARSQPKEHFASAYNKFLGEQDGSVHKINEGDMKKFKYVITRKLKRANLL